MAPSSVLLRWILRKVAASASNSPNILRLIDLATNSPIKSLPRGVFDLLAATTNSGKKCSSSSSPWLMLPPDLKGNTNSVVFKFYSLAEDQVLNFYRKRVDHIFGEGGDDIDFISSSSHGWLTLYNRRSYDLFLFNPLSGRHIQLPSIHPLGIPYANLKAGFQCITKVITSCSPEQQDCRVMMSYGPNRRLAFCSPTSSSAEWTPIGDPCYKASNGCVIPRKYQDFVYSSRLKLFYATTNWEDFEVWDLHDTWSGAIMPIFKMYPADLQTEDYPWAPDIEDELNYPYCAQPTDGTNYPWLVRTKEEMKLKMSCISMIFLVVEEESGDLFWVRRHIIPHMALDGSLVDYNLDRVAARKLPYKTVAFDVHKYDPDIRDFVFMKRSLDGLALFIGNNHSFAISASKFPELKPNSIYFTDTNIKISPNWRNLPFGGHDVGIYNFEDSDISPCHLPCQRKKIKRIIPPPMWFTPTF